MLYPSRVSWDLQLKPETRSLLELIGKKTSQKIKRTLRQLEGGFYRFEIVTVDDALLQQFIPVYQKTIGQKDGFIADVAAEVQEWRERGDICEAITLFRNEAFLGALLYAYNDSDSLDAAFQALPLEIDRPLPISPGYLAEYYFAKRAIQLGKTRLSRGYDGNPFGLPRYTAIGLADYKLRMGYTPTAYPVGEFKNSNDLISDRDALVLLAERPHQVITQGTLFTHDVKTAERIYKSLVEQTKVEVKLQKYPT